MRRSVWLVLLGLGALGCTESPSSDDTPTMMGAAGTPAAMTSAGQSGSAAGSGGSAGSSSAGATQPAGSASAGVGGTAPAAGQGGVSGNGDPIDAGRDAGPDAETPDGSTGDSGTELDFAAELDELFIHDACTGEYAPQPDTCLHELNVEHEITFGGTTGSYDVSLRVRGLFEPTTINGGQAPLAQDPYFKVGGTVAAADYSQWHIKVSSPQQTYWLNHYPSTSHTIYLEDYEATITVEAGATITVGATDGNDREIDNAEEGIADRRQLIEGVTDEVLDGQMLRLDVISVVPH